MNDSNEQIIGLNFRPKPDREATTNCINIDITVQSVDMLEEGKLKKRAKMSPNDKMACSSDKDVSNSECQLDLQEPSSSSAIYKKQLTTMESEAYNNNRKLVSQNGNFFQEIMQPPMQMNVARLRDSPLDHKKLSMPPHLLDLPPKKMERATNCNT